MKREEIKVKFNGDEKTILFDTTKLFRIVDEKLNEYVDGDDCNYDDIIEQTWNGYEDVFGENVSMEFRVSEIKKATSYGCDYILFDMEAIVTLKNPKTGNEIVIRHEAKDFEYEGMIYDPMQYYGVSWKDFM